MASQRPHCERCSRGAIPRPPRKRAHDGSPEGIGACGGSGSTPAEQGGTAAGYRAGDLAEHTISSIHVYNETRDAYAHERVAAH